MQKFQFKAAMAVTAALLTGVGATAQGANLTYSGAGKWETAANWGGTVPGSVDTALVDGDADVLFDDDTWSDLSANGMLTGGATGEYRLQLIRVANFGTDAATFNFSNANTIRTTSTGLTYIGSGAGSNGTLNMQSGNIIAESNTLAIGEKADSTGLLNVTGGSYIAGRESGGNSVNLGTAGTGRLQISDGIFRSRAGLTLGSNGYFDLRGSGVDEVGIGSHSSIDGRWIQNAGGTLGVGVDAGGVTAILIDDVGDDGSGTQGNVTFDSGSILDPYDLGGATSGVWHTIMNWEGTLTNNGLALSPTASASGWGFRIEGSTLQVMLVPEPASLGLLSLGALFMRRRRA